MPDPLVIQCAITGSISCGSAGGRAVRDEPLGPLELSPEMASLDCGSINFREQLFEGDRPLLRRMIPDSWPWSVCAIGRAQLPLNAYCILAGGPVRTGLKDNLCFRRGQPAKNAALVERVVRIAAELGRPVATPAEARTLVGLPG